MIEYSNETKPNFMFFAGEGSWGDASDIVIVNVDELDGHFSEVIEGISEYSIPDFMRWYVDNQTHDQQPNDYLPCEVCELWEQGTEDEIIEKLEEEEDN
jgi:hypothetical protein